MPISSRAALALALLVAPACTTGSDDGGPGLSAGNLSMSTGGTDTTANASMTDASTSAGTGSASASASGGTTTGATSNSSNVSDSETGSGTSGTTGEPGCVDADGDNYGEGCALGPDCDDNDFNNHTAEGCTNCMDADADNVWSGCDQYDENKQGPDCDDNNDAVGLDDAVEKCNGLAENCAGEIDPLPPDQMCPSEGDPPNVGGWSCAPPMPGVDGCKIAFCDEGFYDANATVADGCECPGTDRTKSLEACGNEPQGSLGVIAEGGQAANVPTGTIPFIDNGVGNGAEDWYSIEFPEAMATGKRPFAGIIQVTFAKNDGDDYRFEVYRDCNTQAFSASLATQFGAGAPPAKEWWFLDTPMDPNAPAYSNTVTWPNKVYVRVFRTKNDKTCNSYQLSVKRVAN